MYLSVIGILLLAVIVAYFYNNPLGYSRWFMMRRFINWFPLGMTYAFLCMGRYNLIVAKSALGHVDVQAGFRNHFRRRHVRFMRCPFWSTAR